jgi:hypothetical protein
MPTASIQVSRSGYFGGVAGGADPVDRPQGWVFVFEPTPGRGHNLLVMGLVRAGVDGDLCEASGASTWPSATSNSVGAPSR